MPCVTKLIFSLEATAWYNAMRRSGSHFENCRPRMWPCGRWNNWRRGGYRNEKRRNERDTLCEYWNPQDHVTSRAGTNNSELGVQKAKGCRKWLQQGGTGVCAVWWHEIQKTGFSERKEEQSASSIEEQRGPYSSSRGLWEKTATTERAQRRQGVYPLLFKRSSFQTLKDEMYRNMIQTID